MATYHVYGAAVFSIDKPQHPSIEPPNSFATSVINEGYLVEFVLNMNGWTVVSNATTYAAICMDIRNQARNHLRASGGAQPILSPLNPIVDVYVNDSRPSGDAEVWDDSSTFSIHPVTSLNYSPPGIPIAVAAHLGPNGVAQYWISADAYASLL